MVTPTANGPGSSSKMGAGAAVVVGARVLGGVVSAGAGDPIGAAVSDEAASGVADSLLAQMQFLAPRADKVLQELRGPARVEEPSPLALCNLPTTAR